ncbi:hypothetical protein FRC11_009718, partial [Ceratobasidium sp. 423]
MAPKSASQPTLAKSTFTDADATTLKSNKTSASIDPSSATTTPKRGTSMLSAIDGSLGTSVKKAKMDAGKADGADAPCSTVVDPNEDDEEPGQATPYYSRGNKLQALDSPPFSPGTTVAFLSNDGDTLGHQVSDLEKWLGHKLDSRATYLVNPSWITWQVADKTKRFCNVKLLAYIPLNENCQATVVLVKEGCIAEQNVDWIRSWVLNFECEIGNHLGLEYFVDLACGKPTKKLKVLMTLIPDMDSNHSKWEMHMVGTVESKLLIMHHDEEAEYTLQSSTNKYLVKVKAQNGQFTGYQGKFTLYKDYVFNLSTLKDNDNIILLVDDPMESAGPVEDMPDVMSVDDSNSNGPGEVSTDEEVSVNKEVNVNLEDNAVGTENVLEYLEIVSFMHHTPRALRTPLCKAIQYDPSEEHRDDLNTELGAVDGDGKCKAIVDEKIKFKVGMKLILQVYGELQPKKQPGARQALQGPSTPEFASWTPAISAMLTILISKSEYELADIQSLPDASANDPSDREASSSDGD